MYFVNEISKIEEILKDIKLFIINYLESIIKDQLKDNYKLGIYGSFATKLAIECSDIDINIAINNGNQQDIEFETITNISKILINLNIFDVFPILTAKVPIIKLDIDPLKILQGDLKSKFIQFLTSDLYFNYPFDKSDLLKIKIDINFSKSDHMFNSVSWVNEQISKTKEIVPLIKVIKRQLKLNQLNNSFEGGLSSYSLLLLLISYLKVTKTKGLGQLLFEYYYFYGNYYNITKSIIDANNANPFKNKLNEYDNMPYICDPLIYHNVSNNAYRINDILYLYSKSYEFLKSNMENFERSFHSRNILFDLLYIPIS